MGNRLWGKEDILERNLHTIGEFFPLPGSVFNILNMCSASFSLYRNLAGVGKLVFNMPNMYSVCGR